MGLLNTVLTRGACCVFNALRNRLHFSLALEVTDFGFGHLLVRHKPDSRQLANKDQTRSHPKQRFVRHFVEFLQAV
ncbi:MAG: hypothetical protein ABI893_03635 [Polaromonas sp.]|uniref:hypothetical protein n=1 Tax=Polaromonas sp. TaxID=1869339 RepID=UPI003264CEDA